MKKIIILIAVVFLTSCAAITNNYKMAVTDWNGNPSVSYIEGQPINLYVYWNAFLDIGKRIDCSFSNLLTDEILWQGSLTIPRAMPGKVISDAIWEPGFPENGLKPDAGSYNSTCNFNNEGTATFVFGVAAKPNTNRADPAVATIEDHTRPSRSTGTEPSISRNTEPSISRNTEPSISTGTGFHVGLGYIVTNHHVIKGGGQIIVRTNNGDNLESQVITSDPANDLAILKVSEPGKLLGSIPFSNNNTSLGDEVYTIGFPIVGLLGVSPKYTNGVVSSLKGLHDDPRFLQITVPVQPGNSGGPLLNKKGHLVGVVSSSINESVAYDKTGSLPQNINYAVKASYIQPLISTLDENVKLTDMVSNNSRTINKVTKSIVLIANINSGDAYKENERNSTENRTNRPKIGFSDFHTKNPRYHLDLSSNEYMDQTINSAIQRDKSLASSKITAFSFNGVILLVGEARDYNVRSYLGGLVLSMSGVKQVYNETSTSFQGATFDYDLDTSIVHEVLKAFYHQEVAGPIRIVVAGRKVYLMGVAAKQDGQKAAVAASLVSGVTRVIKTFEYTD